MKVVIMMVMIGAVMMMVMVIFRMTIVLVMDVPMVMIINEHGIFVITVIHFRRWSNPADFSDRLLDGTRSNSKSKTQPQSQRQWYLLHVRSVFQLLYS